MPRARALVAGRVAGPPFTLSKCFFTLSVLKGTPYNAYEVSWTTDDAHRPGLPQAPSPTTSTHLRAPM